MQPVSLHAAAARGSIKGIQTALAEGSDVNEVDGDRRTPLLRATEGGHVDAMNLLLTHGAEPNHGTARWYRPLMAACEAGIWTAAKILLDAGADVGAMDDEGTTALHFAAGYGDDVSIIDLLVSHGADVDAARIDGATALMWAAAVGRRKHVQALLRLHADPALRSESGMTASDYALARGHSAVVAMLSRWTGSEE